jgi:hypothetical protein
MPFASATVPRHLLRGALGLLALVGGVVLGGWGLLLLVVTVAAWRGCPTCWAVGLIQTRERCHNSSTCRPSLGAARDPAA